ncbi:hypothetical protein ACFB49_27140 [Sphingomonas sp. DBB INV C78]|uniref:response regulator n=1 Tax=Sphingomonas sp. DBB INV C78 TaxID=3349434 RepID=UPI0036D2BFF9
MSRVVENPVTIPDDFVPSPVATGEGEAAPERARILVVDDDERNLLALGTVLEDVAEVVTARSGTEALRLLLREQFAVILLDVYMPDMDGYETAQLIRSRDQTRRIPIIFLSAVNKEAQHLQRGYAMGAVDYVFKPVEPLVLRSKVSVFVDLYQMTREIQRKAEQEQRLLDAALKAKAEHLQAERKLRLAEQRQAAIIECLPIILYLEDIGPSRAPTFVSGNFQALTGFTLEDVRASPTFWADRLHPEDREKVLAEIGSRQDRPSFAVEYRWKCASGQYRHFLDQAILLRDVHGEAMEYAGTLLDISERKELEGELLHARKMDAIGKLTGGIAHDFNNLLASVLGGLSMIERRVELGDKERKLVEMTRHAAEQGAELVGRLLAFARKQKLEPGRVELRDLSRSIEQLLDHTLGGLVRIEWQPVGAIWPAFVDGAQLELALINLIINARDAMPEGGAIIVREVNESLPDGNDLGLVAGDYVSLTVVDSGCGIPADLIDRVMEPFFTTKEVGKGTGLGLSMVFGFVQQSGGAMRIRSNPGVGTEVQIWLPRAPDLALVPKLAPAHAPLVENPLRLRILLVDDHDGVRVTTAAMIEDLGHDVRIAADGKTALELMAADPLAFDLIVTDYAMPSMSGLELLTRIHALHPELRALVVTGYAEKDDIAVNQPLTRMLAKPFTQAQLSNAIAASIEPLTVVPEKAPPES